MVCSACRKKKNAGSAEWQENGKEKEKAMQTETKSGVREPKRKNETCRTGNLEGQLGGIRGDE